MAKELEDAQPAVVKDTLAVVLATEADKAKDIKTMQVDDDPVPEKGVESSSDDSSSDASSDSDIGNIPPVLDEEEGNALKWFVIGKTVHLLSYKQEVKDLSMCREDTGKAFKTKPRERREGWSDTIERLGVCRRCWSSFESSMSMQPALTLEEPLRAGGETSPSTRKASDSHENDSE